MITLYDRILFCGIIIFSGILMIILNFCVYSGTAMSAVIEVNGELYAQYKLADITDEKVIDVITEYGSNTVVISNGEVSVTEASCKDKLDVMSKPISKPNQTIVCIPNRMTIRITGNNESSNGIDKVAY